ncbi:hypothetical protein KVV02_006030 [Mortierella alpina]|uniref:Uncharacterized protein n=1 Tax=Mortierella alpina TaxID=64518 RepID=A0A9P8A8T2_MORAP|nr:hypothetical protein KVV02_006030 [Mortierella alpina]
MEVVQDPQRDHRHGTKDQEFTNSKDSKGNFQRKHVATVMDSSPLQQKNRMQYRFRNYRFVYKIISFITLITQGNRHWKEGTSDDDFSSLVGMYLGLTLLLLQENATIFVPLAEKKKKEAGLGILVMKALEKQGPQIIYGGMGSGSNVMGDMGIGGADSGIEYIPVKVVISGTDEREGFAKGSLDRAWNDN